MPNVRHRRSIPKAQNAPQTFLLAPVKSPWEQKSNSERIPISPPLLLGIGAWTVSYTHLQQWCLVRNRDIFTEKTDVVGDDFSNYTLLSLTTKGVIPRDLESGKGKFPSDFKSYKIVHKNDIAFCLFDIDETPRTVGLANEDGMLTGAYTIYPVSYTHLDVYKRQGSGCPKTTLRPAWR